jgi:hypothetical protein
MKAIYYVTTDNGEYWRVEMDLTTGIETKKQITQSEYDAIRADQEIKCDCSHWT